MKLKLLFLAVLLAMTGASLFAQNNARMLTTPNAQTGTSYTFVAADQTRIVTFNNASPVAATLPNGTAAGFGDGTVFTVVNLGAGAVTITCLSCTISAAGVTAATLTLSQGQGADIYGGYGTPAVNYAAFGSCTPAITCVGVSANNAFTGNNTFTGQLLCKNLEYTRCVDGPNNAGWAGAGPGNWIDSAGADCGGSTCTVVIAANTGTGSPTTPLANVLYIDYRPKGTGDGPNEVALNVWDGTAFNNQEGSTGAYARSLLTCGRAVPTTANKSWGCIRSYLYLSPGVMGAGPGLASIAPLLFTQNNTDTMTNRAFTNSIEIETFFTGTGLSLYDMRGATINFGDATIFGSPVGTVGTVRLLDTQPYPTVPSALHIQNWIGYNAENPGIPAASLTATGTVNCTGTSTVTWVSGDKFTDRGMLGYPITINGVVYTIATVTSPPGTTMTVNSATGAATTCPTGSGYAFTFAGNMYSEVMNGNVWLRGDQSAATPTDSNGAGGIILDTNGSGGPGRLARNSIVIRDVTSFRNADGTFRRGYLLENNGVFEIWNQAFGQPTIFLEHETGRVRGVQALADQGAVCTNGELALSAGWQSTGSATVTAVAGNGQTCSWTITTGTTTAANPTVTDTLTNALPAATTVCELNIHGGTHTPAAGEGFTQTTLSATAPIFTFIGTPTAGGTTYFVTRRCGP
jgi:hypothetical protein